MVTKSPLRHLDADVSEAGGVKKLPGDLGSKFTA